MCLQSHDVLCPEVVAGIQGFRMYSKLKVRSCLKNVKSFKNYCLISNVLRLQYFTRSWLSLQSGLSSVPCSQHVDVSFPIPMSHLPFTLLLLMVSGMSYLAFYGITRKAVQTTINNHSLYTLLEETDSHIQGPTPG